MALPGNGREKCNVEGKDIYPTREEARTERDRLKRVHGQAKAYPCAFGDHWHITKGARARKWRR
jgi:hypothetical protein